MSLTGCGPQLPAPYAGPPVVDLELVVRADPGLAAAALEGCATLAPLGVRCRPVREGELATVVVRDPQWKPCFGLQGEAHLGSGLAFVAPACATIPLATIAAHEMGHAVLAVDHLPEGVWGLMGNGTDDILDYVTQADADLVAGVVR